MQSRAIKQSLHTTTRSTDARAEVYDSVDALAVQPPAATAAEVPRRALVDRLVAGSDTRVVVVTAPAGYGKSALLRQWSDADARTAIWLSCERDDADRTTFLRKLAVALDGHERLPDNAFDALDRPLTVAGVVRQQFHDVLATARLPFILLLDNCQHLGDDLVADLAGVLGEIPQGSTLALVGRSIPDLPFARPRMEGLVLDLGACDLAMSRDETKAMVELDRSALDAAAADELYDLTEGWTAGIKLVLSSASAGASTGDLTGSVPGLHPTKRHLAEYVHEELFTTLDDEQLSFLRCTSILDRVSAPLCDFVLDRTDSALRLEDLHATGSLLTAPHDGNAGSYRHNRLVAAVLGAELQERDHELYRTLHTRASEWFERHGDVNTAIRHAIQAGDRDRCGALIFSHATPYAGRGDNATVGIWLQQVDPAWFTEVPTLALARVLFAIRTVDSAALDESLEQTRQALEHHRGADNGPSVEVAMAAVSAIAGRAHLKELIEQTEDVRSAGRDGNPWWAPATGLQGAARLLLGEVDRARALLDAAIPDLWVTPDWCAIVLAHLALAHHEEGDRQGAGAVAAEARALVDRNDLHELPELVELWAFSALIEAHQGDRDVARACADRARSSLAAIGNLRGFATRLQVQVPACLAEAYLMIGELEAAEQMCQQAAVVAWVEPDAITAHRRTAWVRAELDQIALELPAGVTITPAERRVLDLLPTHASIGEIADELFVARNTVKSHALSIYRKLGVSSRGAAVQRARDAHLLA